MTSKPIEVFFSYSHKDEPFREQLEIHLSMLKRQGLIKPWHDRVITAGDEWKGQIDDNLDAADIVLLLVTANFLASDYCYDIEMKRAMERHEIGEARVVPIIITPVEGWRHSPFAKLQVLPKDGKPVTKWEDRDEAFVNVAQGIRKSIELLSQAKPVMQAASEQAKLPTRSNVELQHYIREVDKIIRDSDFDSLSVIRNRVTQWKEDVTDFLSESVGEKEAYDLATIFATTATPKASKDPKARSLSEAIKCRKYLVHLLDRLQ